MKHFRPIIIVILAVIVLLFIADICFMVSLYNSIKERYISDVEQCLRRADLVELIDRLDRAGLANEEGVVGIWVGLQRSDISTARTPEELLNVKYSQGYKRMDRQVISVITKYLHDNYEDSLPSPDFGLLEEVFRRELSFSGFSPEEVVITGVDDAIECDSRMWVLEHRVDGELIYSAYISPLAKNVLREMSGIVFATASIAIVLAFAFWYLLHIISRLRTIEEMKDDFTNNMTHELKTPIAIAYAANDALLQFPDSSDEVRTRKYLTAALEQLTKLTGLVENILSMSMERRKNLALNKETIRLRHFIQSIIEQQEMKIKKPCRINLCADEDVALQADATHLSNILNNLIDNSVKYSGDEVEVNIHIDRNGISVADNGIGIPGKYLPDIFDKFYRVPTGNRQNVRGYGIGLFYVKSIVDKHGWTIHAESKPGKGTKFTINFENQ